VKRPESSEASDRKSKLWPPPRPPSNLDVDEKLDFVMREIAAEIAAGKKPFSPSGRGPNVQMVLWRAGFSPGFLEAKGVSKKRDSTQSDRKAKIQRWLASLYGAKAVGRNTDSDAAEPGSASGDSTQSGGDLEHYKQYIHDLELELVEANAKIAELTANKEA
jgi:hypothetical protein